jgi:hypothetical protein
MSQLQVMKIAYDVMCPGNLMKDHVCPNSWKDRAKYYNALVQLRAGLCLDDIHIGDGTKRMLQKNNIPFCGMSKRKHDQSECICALHAEFVFASEIQKNFEHILPDLNIKKVKDPFYGLNLDQRLYVSFEMANDHWLQIDIDQLSEQEELLANEWMFANNLKNKYQFLLMKKFPNIQSTIAKFLLASSFFIYFL